MSLLIVVPGESIALFGVALESELRLAKTVFRHRGMLRVVEHEHLQINNQIIDEMSILDLHRSWATWWR